MSSKVPARAAHALAKRRSTPMTKLMNNPFNLAAINPFELLPFGRSVDFAERMLDDFFPPSIVREARSVLDKAAAPSLRTNMLQEANSYLITVEVPGVPLSDIHLDVDESEGLLYISADKRYKSPEPELPTKEGGLEKEEEVPREKREGKDAEAGGTWHLFERAYGHAERTIRLPPNADLTKVDAKVEHGVLTITIPKGPFQEPESRKPIAIKAE